MHPSRTLEPIATGFNSPEGPAFAANGDLYFVNWLTSGIYCLDATGLPRQVANTGGIPAGLAFHRDGTLYCADEGAAIHGVITIRPDGTIAPFVSHFEGRPLNGANDLVFDQHGVLYFSDPWGSSVDRPIGAFYRAFPDGRLEQLDRGLAFPNGVAISPDGSLVFLAETRHNRVLCYQIRPDGSVGPRQLFANLSGRPGPDGMAFDADGRLYIAHHGNGRVVVLDSRGREIDEMPVPGRQPTNVAFGGPDFDTLVITEVETASIYRVRTGVRGQPLFGGLQPPP